MADGRAKQDADEDLLQRIKLGGEQSYAELLEAHSGRLIGFLFKTYGPLFDDEERKLIVHYATYSAWRAIGTYDNTKASFRGWLVRITQNEAVSFLRAEKKHLGAEFQFDEDFNPMDECAFDDPPEDVADSWEVTQLKAIIANELSPNERLLTEADKAAGGEAATACLSEKLQCSNGSVYATRSKARLKIKESMERRLRERGNR